MLGVVRLFEFHVTFVPAASSACRDPLITFHVTFVRTFGENEQLGRLKQHITCCSNELLGPFC